MFTVLLYLCVVSKMSLSLVIPSSTTRLTPTTPTRLPLISTPMIRPTSSLTSEPRPRTPDGNLVNNSRPTPPLWNVTSSTPTGEKLFPFSILLAVALGIGVPLLILSVIFLIIIIVQGRKLSLQARQIRDLQTKLDSRAPSTLMELTLRRNPIQISGLSPMTPGEEIGNPYELAQRSRTASEPVRESPNQRVGPSGNLYEVLSKPKVPAKRFGRTDNR